ncbi:signal peptide peptidase SppA [Thalassotalea marina]|uniref:Protease n=1 Tax=Thalassotalea marina TaxID=1673741 RepID=A0A919BH24_9GAMM|nr:signal peptide peptidase SppA [Thalassotalea marina]GHF91743.1 protease [Thalassotalea marina]
MSDNQPGAFSRISRSIFHLLNTTRKIIINLIFFTIILIFLVALASDEEQIKIPPSAALVLDLHGDLVEQKVEVDPMEVFVNEALDQPQESPEVLVQDVIDVIERAKNDNRIKLLVLKPQGISSASITKVKMIAKAIERFKSSGKRVIAIGDGYTQAQYYIATLADEIWLDPNGWLLLDGYGRYQLYFKSALDKLAISQHVFRVGTYKSAVEPYMRDDMSPEAKEANQAWLNDLWTQYKTDVAARRQFKVDNFDESITTLIDKLEKADGKIAQYALNNHWVDELKNRHEMNSAISEIVGSDEDDVYHAIGFRKYLKATAPIVPLVNPNKDSVAVIVAKGVILDGTRGPGSIGGDSTASYLRQARLDDSVKAVVLRVDSPGGSAFASDVIRQEIELIKEAGKPVVASMGTYAASGGYWISAPADKIIASPTTITGSIGIYGFLMTFENTLEKVGIFTDGVGTTDLAGAGITQGLSKGVSQIFQLSIERGYQDFIELVANNRNMTLAQVDKIAQGRVWSGTQAHQLGLVDELGDLDDAVSLAADLAKLDDYQEILIEKELSPEDIFWKNFFSETAQFLPVSNTVTTATPLDSFIKTLKTEFKAINELNDPQGIYAKCLACEIN